MDVQMKDKVTAFLKQRGIQLGNTEIENFSTVLEVLIEEKKKLTAKKEQQNFQKEVSKLFAEFQPGVRQLTLFPNEVPDDNFGIPSALADNYSKALSVFEKQEARIREDYIHGTTTEISIDDSRQLGFKFGDEIQDINGAEDIFDLLRRNVKNGTVLQHYCALWNYATIQGSFHFKHVPIDKVLETFLKKPGNGYFRQPTRANFTKSIKVLERMFLRVPVTSAGKGSKKTSGYINAPLTNFSLSIENKKGDVVLILIGELLGKINPGSYRARVFPNGIFDLDARSEGARIMLAFRLATRFSQLNHKPIVWTRKKLIEQAGLADTDNVEKYNG